MDMLSGDADLSDIGDLLKADENGEELEHSEDEDSEVQDEFERLGSIEELKDLKEAKAKRKNRDSSVKLCPFYLDRMKKRMIQRLQKMTALAAFHPKIEKS